MIRRYIEWIVQFRWLVIVMSLVATGLLLSQAKNLKIIIDPNSIVPRSHPFVATTLQVEEVFGSRYVTVIGITPKNGDVFQPAVLEKVQRITAKLRETPRVIKTNLLSIAARRAKDIVGTADGMQVEQLMPEVPRTPEQMAHLKEALARNPVYLNSVVSADYKTAAVLAEVRDATPAELKGGKGGFTYVQEKIDKIVNAERDDTVDIAVSGYASFLTLIEGYSKRLFVILFPLAILVIGLVHWEAFRTLQGLILPLVTPIFAVVWGLGIMGISKVPLDIFNTSTPILILAVGAGHAVQLLKRYYEEFNRLVQEPGADRKRANRQAVIDSVTLIGPVMLTAGLVAAIGFFSLTVFDIISIRVFGIFTAVGILSALVLEMTFIPALRAVLPAPGEREARLEREERFWDGITGFYGRLLTGPHRGRIFVATGLVIVFGLVGMSQLRIESSLKKYFSPALALSRDDAKLNDRLAGTNNIYILFEGDKQDAIKDPEVLKAMDGLADFLATQPHVGKVISLAEFIKRMNLAMNGNDPAYYRIPDKQATIAEYLLLYSMSGEPGDFDPYVDYDYRLANMVVFSKSDSTLDMAELWRKTQAYAADKLPKNVKLGIGGSVAQSAAIAEVIVKDKILNIMQVAGVVFVVASLVFRSLAAGLIVITPLLLSVLVNMGIMGVTGIRLNVPSALTSALAIGIGADYAIYMLYRLKEELGKGTPENEALRRVLRTAGKACLFVASAVAGGYAVQLFSNGYYPHVWSGVLIGAGMIVSVTAALTLMPALLMKFRPRFVFGGPHDEVAVPAVAVIALAALALAMSALAAPAYAMTPVEIMERNFVATKYQDSTADTTMTLTNKTGKQRVRKTFGTTKLQSNGVDNMRMTRFLEPADVKGTVSLLIEQSDKDDDMWIYLPSTKKVRRLVSSNKKDSFVGTDFSYGDVMGHKVKEWDHKVAKEEDVDGTPCYVVESVPKDAAVKVNSGYSKRVNWIRKDTYVTVKSVIYDEAGDLLKEARYRKYQEVDATRHRWQALEMESRNAQTEHSTLIVVDQLKTNTGVKDDYFTTRYMEQQ